jgi:hypothetical protein
VKHWILNKRLQAIQHSEDLRQEEQIAALNKEAGEARKEASAADERAARAESETARLNKLAEEERLARVKIEERIAWRTLTQEQQHRIRNELMPFSGQEFSLATYRDDQECMGLYNTLNSIAVAAGWKYPNPTWGTLLGILEQGITLRLSPSANEITKHAANALATALKHEGMATTIVFDPPAAPVNSIQIRVGKKP